MYEEQGTELMFQTVELEELLIKVSEEPAGSRHDTFGGEMCVSRE